MGKLYYGSAGVAIDFDDRTLAHLQLVLGAKLRRHESLFFSWRDAAGGTRGSIWVSSASRLYFTFATNARHVINREWLETLTNSSNSAQGLWLSAEEAPVALSKIAPASSTRASASHPLVGARPR